MPPSANQTPSQEAIGSAQDNLQDVQAPRTDATTAPRTDPTSLVELTEQHWMPFNLMRLT